MSEAIAERLSQININLNIDEILKEIGKTCKEVGIGNTPEEINEGIRRLYSKLASLSTEMVRSNKRP